MNQKQKFGYTFLGVMIMLVGIGVGSIVSPPLIAQRDGVFGEIKCTKLTVVDEAGKTAIVLGVLENGNHVTVVDKTGKPAIILGVLEDENQLAVFDKTGKPAIALYVPEDGNRLAIYDKTGKTSDWLICH